MVGARLSVSMRSIVILLILYVGWFGVLVAVVPVMAYKKTRAMGANFLQALFLAAVSCLLFSWVMSLGEAHRPPRFSKVHLNCQLCQKPLSPTKSLRPRARL